MDGFSSEYKIAIIDYGCGNVGSVKNMFSKIGIWSELISNPTFLKDYDAIVLPGVGAFDNGVNRLKQADFWREIKSLVETESKPILGICLGMQLFFEGSEEGVEKGFGWIPGTLQKFDKSKVRVPHMGWNSLSDLKDEQLFIAFQNEFYFAHSYHAPITLSEEYCLAKCDYTQKFPAAVSKDNIVGFQFHPEKSLSNGMQLLKNWFNKYVVK